MTPLGREDLIDMIDARVNIGIEKYDLNYQQRRHQQNQEAIHELSKGHEAIRRKLSFYAGCLAICIPLVEFLLRKWFG